MVQIFLWKKKQNSNSKGFNILSGIQTKQELNVIFNKSKATTKWVFETLIMCKQICSIILCFWYVFFLFSRIYLGSVYCFCKSHFLSIYRLCLSNWWCYRTTDRETAAEKTFNLELVYIQYITIRKHYIPVICVSKRRFASWKVSCTVKVQNKAMVTPPTLYCK